MSKQRLSQSKELLQANPNKARVSSIDVIHQTKQSLDQVISQLNNKLHDHFSKKEQQLLDKYKSELVQSQKQLKELKTHTNEEQIKNKMAERKKELEKERHQLIQTNVFFSHKCEEYKKKLNQLIAEGKELEKEMAFLDSQINNANKRKDKIYLEHDLLTPPRDNQTPPKKAENKDRTKSEKQKIFLPLVSDRKQQQVFTAQKRLKNSQSLRSAGKGAKAQKDVSNQDRLKLSKSRELAVSRVQKQLQKTVLQQLFETTIEQIKGKRKGKRNLTSIKGEQFSQYEKKLIMQQFLSKDEVKKQIYSIIFDLDEKPNYFVSAFQSDGNKRSSLFMENK